MPNRPEKMDLGENHRRAVSVLMRGLERACDDAVALLEYPSNLLMEVKYDVTPSQDRDLRALFARLKKEIQNFAAKMELEKVTMSRCRSIAAIASAALIDLQEVEDSGLKGYGPLPKDAERMLAEQAGRMAKILQEILHVAED